MAVDQTKLYPLKFVPVYMERIWGGNMLEDVLGRALPEHTSPIGESWDVTDRDDVQSIIANGELAGTSLHQLVRECPQAVIGRKFEKFDRFPLMVKLIDAGDRLSLQVHPDEAACRAIGHGCEAKNEMWYIIAAREGAKILAGLRSSSTRVQVMDMIDSDDVTEVMQTFDSRSGDSYYIAAGTLHAIGAGNLILEIQQNSDTTFRVNDWGRRDAAGNPRVLHKQEGLQSVNFTNRTNLRVPGSVGESRFNRKFDVVRMCPHFQVSELKLCSMWNDDTSAGDCFHLLSAVKKRFSIGREDKITEVSPGETVLVPACFGQYTITPLDSGESAIIKTTL